MKKENVEQKVDRLLRHNDNSTRYRTRHSKKMLKGSGLLVLLISALLVSGSLFVLSGIYTGTQESDMDLIGVPANLYFDGFMTTSEYFNIPMDIMSMSAGDSFTFEHSVEAIDGCDWDMSFDASDVVGFPTEHIYHGFYFDIVSKEAVSIIDDIVLIRAGHPVTLFDFIYDLDPLFLNSVDPLPYSVDVILTQHVDIAPVAVNDEGTVVHDVSLDIYVLDNDWDPEGGDLEIIAVDNQVIPGVGAEIWGTYPNQYITFRVGPIGVFEINYTIEDDTGLTDIGIVTLTVT